MADIDDILEAVLNDKKLRNSKSCRDKIYSDQPLIKKASQIKTPKTPQKIKDMKALAYTPEAYWKTSAWLFYTQGCFMADYFDVYEYNESFNNIFPTYAGLSNEQLRGYFSWRLHIRNGETSNAPFPFIIMYAYELINGIGLKTPEEGFEKLFMLWEHFGSSDSELQKQLSPWLSDYAVYYGLGSEYIEKCPNFRLDLHMLSLIHYKSSSDDETFSAVKEFSPYDISSSVLYCAHPEEFKTAVVRSYRSIADYFAKHRKKSFFENCFGSVSKRPVRLFENAVFYDRIKHDDTTLEINEIRRYTCKNNAWICCGYNDKIRLSKNLGEFVRAVDSLLRRYIGFSPEIPAFNIPKNTEKLIKTELLAIDDERRRKEASEVKIDLSRLSAIRSDADETRDALLTEDDIAELEAANALPEAEVAENSDRPEESILSEGERAFLSTLLSGGNCSETAKKYGSVPSLMADSINEKLFDIFADTVIDFSGAVPEIIEDYREELHEYI